MSVLKKFNPDTQQWEILQGGVQGLQGPPVALSKGTVTTTAAGTNADFSITGTPPDQKLNLTLPRGEAGGLVAAVYTAQLDDLPAGTYHLQNPDPVGGPTPTWRGYVLAINRSASYKAQVAFPYNQNDDVYYRSRNNSTTWYPWVRVPTVRPGQVHLDIVGAGRPDIPASMTTEVAELVAAATSGAKFRSTDGPQGAWEWQKRGSTWVCVEGDTGDIPLVTWDATGAVTYGTLPSGLAPSGAYPGGVWARRTTSAVHLILRCAQVTTDWTIPGTEDLKLSNGLLISNVPGFASATTFSLTVQIRTTSVVGSRRDFNNPATTYGSGGNNIVTVATFPPPPLPWPLVTTI